MSQPPQLTFNQSGQTIYGLQTNVAGNQIVLEGAAQSRRPIDLEQALARLTELPGEHVPAPADLPGNSRIPYPWNEHFVGRQAELMQLAAALRSENSMAIVAGRSPNPVAATGIGGIGKTQLAAAFAHCYGQYFLGGVYWLSLADPAGVESEFARCAELMDDLPQWVNSLPFAERVPHVQRAWQEPLPRLLIFDNCEEPALLEKWRPKSGGCRILVTSRRCRWTASQSMSTVSVGTLSASESVKLLGKFAPPPNLAQWDEGILTAVAAEVGNLPLALHLAGSYLRLVAPDLTPAHYLQQLRRGDLLRHESLRDGELSPTEHELNVERTFALSFEQLQPSDERDSAARTLLARAAHFAAGESIPRLLLRDAAGLAGEEAVALSATALRRLLDLGLLEEDEAGDLRLHRLLCQFVANALANEVTVAQEDVEVAVLALARQQNNAGDPRPLLHWQPHLRHVAERSAQRQDEIAAALCNTLGFHLDTMGEYTSALPYYERALAIREEVLGAKHPDTANSLNNLGALLNSMGDYAGALPYLERALAIWEEVLGAKHPDTANSLNNLGGLLDSIGDSEGARPYYERALAIREEVLGAKHPDTASSLNNLGYLLNSMGDYAGALPYLERALAIWEEVLGAKHPDTANSLNNLGGLLDSIGDSEGARPYYERALAIREEVLGAKHPDTASSLNNLGGLLDSMGDSAGARPYYERALAIFEEVLGTKHPDTASSLNNLGYLLRAQGDSAGARPYYERALKIREEVFGSKHPHTAGSLNNLGILAYYEGDKQASATYLARALAIYEAVLGANHPDTQETRQSLAVVQAELGEKNEGA